MNQKFRENKLVTILLFTNLRINQKFRENKLVKNFDVFEFEDETKIPPNQIGQEF